MCWRPNCRFAEISSCSRTMNPKPEALLNAVANIAALQNASIKLPAVGSLKGDLQGIYNRVL